MKYQCPKCLYISIDYPEGDTASCGKCDCLMEPYKKVSPLGGYVYQCGICLGWIPNPVRCVHCKAVYSSTYAKWVVDPYLTADIPKDKVFSDTDKINPKHYRSHPSKIECIEITRHHNFNIGNAIKYLWRQGLKDSSPALEDLKKAAWYINDEIKRIENGNTTKTD